MRVSKKVKIRTISVFLILVLIIRLIWPGLLVSIVKRIDPFSFVLFLLAIIIFYSIDIYEGLIKPHLKAAVRFLVFMMCLCLILLRFAKPDLKFDGITINLLIIAVIVIIIPDLIDLLLRIRKVKKGDFEAEFGEAVSNLVDKTIQAEDAAEINSPSNNSYSGISSEVAQRLAEAATDPRGAFLILSIEIESRIRLLGNQLKMGEKNRFMPISSIG